MESDLAKMKRIQKHHYESTTPMDDYFTGMWNGMEVLIASIENREGNFKSVEQLELQINKDLEEKN